MVEKKDLFNCKFKVTFQPDGCAGPTCATMCFIHFGLTHRLDNIQLMLSFSTECMLIVFLFVCLFIHFACELVWNVLVNQKGFQPNQK